MIMDPQVNELTSEIIALCTKRLSCNQTIAFDGHIVITVDSYQLLFLEIKHTHQKETSKNPSSRSSHVPPKKKLLQNRQRFYGRCESSEDEPDHHKVASSISGEEQSDLDKGGKITEDKNPKKFKGDEKAKRHWKKGRKKAFTDAEASRQKEASKSSDNSSKRGTELTSINEKRQSENAVKETRKGSRTENKTKTVHTCDYCSFSTTYRHCLRRHLIRKHTKETGAAPQAPTVREVCSSCGKTFKTKDSLRIHTSLKHGTLGKRYPCTICNREFYMKVHFEGHMNKHKNERPYTCTICGKGFLYVQNVKRHERTCGLNNRTKAKSDVPIECHACGVTFKTKDYFKDHMAAKHSQAPKYKCPVCAKLFRIRGSYYRHKMTCTKRVGLEPGEVHPDVMKNMTNQEKPKMPYEPQHDQQEEIHQLQQPTTEQQEPVMQSTHQEKLNQQSLPNVHQLYHHYRQVHDPTDHTPSPTQSGAETQHRESFLHQDPLQLQHYEILPQNLYSLTPDLQAHTIQCDDTHTELHNLQDGHHNSKSAGHGHHEIRVLHDLQPAHIQNQNIENAQEFITRSEMFSAEEAMVQSLQLHSQSAGNLEILQDHDKSHMQRQSQDQRMSFNSPKKSSSFSSQLYDVQRQSQDTQGQRLLRPSHELLRQSHELHRHSHNLQIQAQVGQPQLHELQRQAHDMPRQLHDLQRQLQQHPSEMRQTQNLSHPATDLNRPADQGRTVMSQAHNFQNQSHDLLVLSHEIQRSQNDPKRVHHQHQGPHDLSQAHCQIQGSMHGSQGHESSLSDLHKGHDLQVDIQSGQGYAVPVNMHSSHVLHSPSHNIEMQHVHKNTSESSLTSQQNIQSQNIDVQCIMSPYNWGKQVN